MVKISRRHQYTNKHRNAKRLNESLLILIVLAVRNIVPFYTGYCMVIGLGSYVVHLDMCFWR